MIDPLYLSPREEPVVPSIRLLPDDKWEVGVMTSSTSLEVTIRGHVIDHRGEIIPFEFVALRGATYTTVQVFPVVAGNLVSIFAAVAGVGIRKRDVFIRVALRRGSSSAASDSMVLLQGYPESQAVLSWPGNLGPMTEYRVVPFVQQVGNGAAGANVSFSFSNAYPLSLEAISFTVTCDANVATRKGLVFGIDATTGFTVWQATTNLTQAAGSTARYSYSRYGARETGLAGTILGVLPDVFNAPDMTYQIVVENIQVGDVISNILILARTNQSAG